MPVLQYIPDQVGRFDAVVQANMSNDPEQLIEACDENIEVLSGLIRESVKNVAKYTKQRTALAEVLRAATAEYQLEQLTF